MATFWHPDLPGQMVQYPEGAGEVLSVSGWVDYNEQQPNWGTPEPEPEPEAKSSKAKSKAESKAEPAE